jgi:hypothetical protein
MSRFDKQRSRAQTLGDPSARRRNPEADERKRAAANICAPPTDAFLC